MPKRKTFGCWLGLAVAASLLLSACHRDSFDEAPFRERGQAALLPFKKALKQALVRGMQKGPEQAIDACRVQAPALAAASSNEEVSVGRTSHKLRNPSNAPEPWMLPLLETYGDPAQKEPRVVEIDEHTVGYVEPIYMQPLCVTCHGTSLAAAVQAQLRAHYPADQATGFEVGDFRGLFWAKIRR